MSANIGLPFDVQPRLSRQCRAMLARLRQGPASNRELAQLSLKYTARISDLRAAGYQVDCVRENYKTGETLYALRDGYAAKEMTP